MRNSKKIKLALLGKFISCLFGVLFFPQSEARLPRYKGEVALEALLKKAKIKCNDLQKLKDSIIEIIYTNEGRKSLANWMRDRRPHKDSECGATHNDVLEIKRESKFKKGSPFFNLLTIVIKEGNVDNCSFSKLANFVFPCWSGTLTCYMHKPAGKSLAKLALEYNHVPQAYRWLLIKEEKFTPLLQSLLELKAQRINNNSISEKKEALAGETAFTKHYEWVYSLPCKIRNNPQSTAKWIVNSTAILSGNIEADGESFEELSRNLKQSIYKLRGTKNDPKLIVKIETWNEDKLCGSWPVEKITIKDSITHKAIIIGSGGDRKHCEIMSIYDYHQ